MRTSAVLAVAGLVLLGGCIGGVGGVGDRSGDDGQPAGGAGGLSADERDRQTEGETTTPPTTTDVERIVNATFVVEDEENVTVSLRVANEPVERRTGLMYRESLANDSGMVFVYGESQEVAFWMKNTLIPLDMIFVASNGTVLNVEHARPQPNASAAELQTYPSDGEAKYVVELPRGFANRTGVGPGSRLVFDGPAPTVESNE